MKDLIERADALAAIALGDTVNQLQAKIRAIPRAHFAAAADLYDAQAAEIADLRRQLAEARDKALEEAADALIECSVWCDSQERTDAGWHNGVIDARKHHMAAIRALKGAAK